MSIHTTALKSLLVIGTLFTTNLFAASGRIDGIVTDKITGETLPGANVIIKGTVLGAATDFEGFFSINNLSDDDYTLTASYVGYEKKEIEVEIRNGNKVELEIELELIAVSSVEITVTGQAKGQIKAINQQLTASSIKNIVSEARIKELPDANAAEALGRLPGVTINRSGGEASSINVRGQSGGSIAYYVEGMRMVGSEGRGVELSNIATSMIGGIELQKSFTPDNDGDVSGGGVLFRLKEAEPEFKSDLIFRQGYNGLTESFKMRDISLTLSDRFLDNKLGVLANIVYDEKDRSLDFLNADYVTKSKPVTSDDLPGQKPVSGLFSSREELRDRWGLTYNIDYAIPDHKIIFNGFYATLDRDVLLNENAIQKTPKQTNYYATKYSEEDNSYLFGLRGEHNISILKLTWGASYSNSTKTRPGEYGIYAYNNDFDFLWEEEDNISRLYSSVEGQHNLKNTSIYETYYSSQDKDASESSFKFDFELPFEFSNSIAGKIKFGGKYRHTERAFEEVGASVQYGPPNIYAIEGSKILDTLYSELQYTRTSDGIVGYEVFADDNLFEFNAGDELNLFYPANFDVLVEAIDRGHNAYRRDMVRATGNYNNQEDLSGAYIMANIGIGPHVTFIPGVRFESYTGKTDATKYVADPSLSGSQIPGAIKPVSSNTKNDLWLPMFTLQVKPLSWFDIRASITKTLQRPSFSSMSPRLSEDVDANRDFGNPNLQPAKSQNYDLYFSFYENYLGLLTLGGFYKNIVDEINQVDIFVLHPEEMGLPAKYLYKTFTTFENNKYKSYMKGLEIDWQTRFWYLPSFLGGIVFNINYTLLDTESKRRLFYETSESVPYPPYRIISYVDSFRVNSVLETPDQTLKFALGYEKGGFSGRISLLYQASAQTHVDIYKNNNEATEEIYRWDIQLSQQIFEGLKLYMNMNNISASPDVVSMMYFKNLKRSIENYGWSMDFGIRYEY